MLSEPWSGSFDFAGALHHGYRYAHLSRFAPLGVLDGHYHLVVLHLRVFHKLLTAADRGTGNVGGFKDLKPVGPGLLVQNFPQEQSEGITVLLLGYRPGGTGEPGVSH